MPLSSNQFFYFCVFVPCGTRLHGAIILVFLREKNCVKFQKTIKVFDYNHRVTIYKFEMGTRKSSGFPLF